ncbi:LPXTG cell wall anchor domain-containing protein [Micromonospora fluostatini]|uniref:LPXTG cell wall anchor domain-containing protein n=1 Tax=Micromonospora fluostatini TaxID=1629071 RepID=A0ABY2DJQ8_9ACTN|nr:LPXTG cell wall anchor domain-containing protein [Micromonospora fluostatini]
MIFRNRPLARLGAAVLLASGTFTALGAPAYASGSETDLSIELVGTRVAANTQGKVAFAKITNLGTNTPGSASVTTDVSKVDFNRVLALPFLEECELEGDLDKPTLWTCDVPRDELPGPGETLEVPLALFKFEELEGTYSAPISVTVSSPDDTNKENNRASATVELTDQNGPDLTVLAADVKQAVTVEGGEIRVVGDLHAGETGRLEYVTVNQGDRTAGGITVSVKLPKGVTFTETEEACEYGADRASAVCTYDNLPLVPLEQDEDEDDKVYSGYEFFHLLSVGEDVKAGSLTGGTVTVEPIAGKPMPLRTAAKAVPKNAVGINAEDVDPSDNTDGYAVIVAARGGSGGGGEEPGLPVTGPQAGLIGGIGGAVLLAGGAMFLVARRRRVVMVAPADEKSSN